MLETVCSFCSEVCPCAEIHGPGLHICDGCSEELSLWAEAHRDEAVAHQEAALAAAFPWEPAWNESHAIGEVA